MATPPSDGAQGSHHDDLEVASAPSVRMDGSVVNGTQSHRDGSVSHDSPSRHVDNGSSVATGTMTSTGTAREHEGPSFLQMMQNMLLHNKSFDSSDNLPSSDALPPMRADLGNNNNCHSYNTLDTAASGTHEDWKDEQFRQTWDVANIEGGHADGLESVISAQNDPSLCSTPPRTRIDPEQAPSLDPPGTNGSRSPRSPPAMQKSNNSNTCSPFGGLFRRPPPGPESSDDELKESLVMENQSQGWFGGLLAGPERLLLTPERISRLEPRTKDTMMDTTLPETPPDKTEYDPFSSVESNDDEDEDGCKVVSDKQTVKVRLIYFVILFFFLLVIVAGLAYFLWYLSDLEQEQSNQARDFVATMRPTALATMEPSLAPSTSSPTGSASPTITASPTGTPTRRPTSPPTKRPTRRPTGMPTKTPTNYPTMETPDLNFMTIMAGISPETAMKMEAPGTTQNRAYQWLARDPDYYNYSDDRKIQRWVLALVKLELKMSPPDTEAPSSVPSASPSMTPTTTAPTQKPTLAPWPTSPPVERGPTRPFFWNFTSTAADAEQPVNDNGGRRLNWDALESWMQYTDECQWFTSYFFNRVSCNAMHQFKRLVLINLDLEGTIPSEISLMSRLETIALPQNRITGTIPTEFGSMRWLNTFNVSYNAMDGSIPGELAAAPALATLDVGNNNFTAPVPSAFCQIGLRVFRGDCSELQCPCCNQCAQELLNVLP
mmetsp:Transcript_1864/g.4221  ORF Transcript_1864/g.4221 Transcript_1864/m.4221 type:complete len:718 (+) Transcript_1864:54-2207(+)